MKFLKLRLKNFKPYLTRGEFQEIPLFDTDVKSSYITLNIGQTGFGKTSISEAIMWCLFGEDFVAQWEDFVNSLSIQIAKEYKEETVDMVVELLLEIGHNSYKVIRQGIYCIDSKQREKNTELYVIYNGEPLPNPIIFIGKNFPVVKLMEYFIFDADDILKKFQDNQKKAIGDHINKLVGVEKLDKIIESLRDVSDLLDREIFEMQNKIQDDLSEKRKNVWEDIKTKEIALKELKEEIEQRNKKKRKLFEPSPTPEEEEFYNLIKKRDSLTDKIEKLNAEFQENKITSNLDLLLLKQILDSTVKKINEKKTSKEEFEGSIKLIQSALGEAYSGLFFKAEDEINLIKKDTQISGASLEKVHELNLEFGGEMKSDAIYTFCEHNTRMKEIEEKFENFRTRYKEAKEELLKTINRIKLKGETTKTKELKEKIEKFKELENQINIRKNRMEEIEEKKREKKNEHKELIEKIKMSEEQESEVKKLKNKQEFVRRLSLISDKAKKEFLSGIINYINTNSSNSLRNIVRDTKRFNSIEIDNDYSFKIKRENGEELKQNQINRGTLTISMLSFFFGLSQYLEKGIPYIIDNPLIRLDPGHDKRLIEELSKHKNQIILHLIPGKEYTKESYNWLKSKINMQNWIQRYEFMDKDLISSVDSQDKYKFIEFNIDEF
ncbi:MAG TPA: AAA family ATPase [Candidatus Paceibacterota bacterium]|nr:AAA family ATPase [Candidatus Paceibacterota bacterium]